MVTANENAVFAREFKVDNRRLQKVRTSLGELTQYSAALTNHRLEIVRLLGELRDQLAIHFALEEACGYFEEAQDIAPHLSARAESLRAEHVPLFEFIRSIADEADQYRTRHSPSLRPPLKVQTDSATDLEMFVSIVNCFQVFERLLAAHEANDNALILDAFDTDLGGGD